MRNIIPVVMAGVLGIYGLIVAVILSGASEWCTPKEAAVEGEHFAKYVRFLETEHGSMSGARFQCVHSPSS